MSKQGDNSVTIRQVGENFNVFIGSCRVDTFTSRDAAISRKRSLMAARRIMAINATGKVTKS